MLSKIRAFFETQTDVPVELTVDEAAAVLLIEVMMADLDADDRERDCVTKILVQRTGEPLAEVERSIDAAFSRQQDTHDLFQFTRVINDQWDEDQRYGLLIDLWRVAFSDGVLDKYEDHRIRRVAELLHLHHSHFIRAKAAAQSLVE